MRMTVVVMVIKMKIRKLALNIQHLAILLNKKIARLSKII
jgi:hypothetical protein